MAKVETHIKCPECGSELKISEEKIQGDQGGEEREGK